MPQSAFAVFIDMMGFADALETLTDAEHIALEELLPLQTDLRGATPPVARLCKRYRTFHDVLAAALHDPFDEESCSLISFSDSAFVVTVNVLEALRFAEFAMCNCLLGDVPVRIGIGHGSFSRLTFASANRPGGAFVTAAPFLGTSIVRAVYAEASKSCKGFRALVHPSVVLAADYLGLSPLAMDESGPSCVAEVDFLDLEGEPLASYTSALETMRVGVSKPSALAHYEATERALRRLAETRNRKSKS